MDWKVCGGMLAKENSVNSVNSFCAQEAIDEINNNITPFLPTYIYRFLPTVDSIRGFADDAGFAADRRWMAMLTVSSSKLHLVFLAF